MKNAKILICLAVVFVMALANFASADIFGTGVNQFTIDFVPISGDASVANGTYIGSDKPEGFIDPVYDYRMGTYEITNDQWDKFFVGFGDGLNLPKLSVSWNNAAQFINWLNTSNNYQAAYKFVGDTFSVWDVTDAGYNSNNPYRNSNAHYFFPTEDEWVKAAYWNGKELQTYATLSGQEPQQGDGESGIGWNYASALNPFRPWTVGSGSQELNGTYDMMGNVWEWQETPWSTEDYQADSPRGLRGGSYISYDYNLESSTRVSSDRIAVEYLGGVGFRVASVPEPATLLLLGLGGLAIRRRHHG